MAYRKEIFVLRSIPISYTWKARERICIEIFFLKEPSLSSRITYHKCSTNSLNRFRINIWFFMNGFYQDFYLVTIYSRSSHLNFIILGINMNFKRLQILFFCSFATFLSDRYLIPFSNIIIACSCNQSNQSICFARTQPERWIRITSIHLTVLQPSHWTRARIQNTS